MLIPTIRSQDVYRIPLVARTNPSPRTLEIPFLNLPITPVTSRRCLQAQTLIRTETSSIFVLCWYSLHQGTRNGDFAKTFFAGYPPIKPRPAMETSKLLSVCVVRYGIQESYRSHWCVFSERHHLLHPLQHHALQGLVYCACWTERCRQVEPKIFTSRILWLFSAQMHHSFRQGQQNCSACLYITAKARSRAQSHLIHG